MEYDHFQHLNNRRKQHLQTTALLFEKRGELFKKA
jgi:hypothetical protein